MSRPRYEFRREHPTEQRAILRRLKGEVDGETPDDQRIVAAAVAELEDLLGRRRRRRRLPSERKARKAQTSLFKRTGRT